MNQSETKLIETGEEVEQARTHLAEMLADGDVAAISKARKAYETVKQAHDDAVLAQGALERREVQAKVEHLAQVKAQQRAKIAELAEERGKIGERITTLVEQLGPEFKRLNELHQEILIQLPGGFDADRASMTSTHDRLLEEFWRHGLAVGSPFSAWELEKRATLLKQIGEGNRYLCSI
jgi:hypothetical protein